MSKIVIYSQNELFLLFYNAKIFVEIEILVDLVGFAWVMAVELFSKKSFFRLFRKSGNEQHDPQGHAQKNVI